MVVGRDGIVIESAVSGKVDIDALGAMASTGMGTIKLAGLNKVLIALFASPLIGFIVGFVVLRVIYYLSWNSSPRINELFKQGQFFTAVGLAFSHGTNDAQKTMGIITLSLLIGGRLGEFSIPTLVVVISAATMALGTLLGGASPLRGPGDMLGGLWRSGAGRSADRWCASNRFSSR